MANRIRWGVLGNSTIGRKCVLPAIKKSNNGTIRALGTQRPAEALEIAEENSVEHIYNSYEQVLRDDKVDAVYIPLPNHLHLPWTVQALAAGKHVLCEKPLACNASQARQMAAVAEKHDRLLMEALMYRFHPRTQHIKTMISEGAIGVPQLVRTAFCFSIQPELLKSGDNYRLQPDQGGGALLDVGPYGVSVPCWYLKNLPVSVQAQAIYHNGTNVDLHLVGNMRFKNDTLATIEASFCSGLQQTFTIVGSAGVVELPHDAFIPWEKDAHIHYRSGDKEIAEVIVIGGADEYQIMVEHFATCILENLQPTVTLAESIGTMTVLDALAEAARTSQTISVDQGNGATG